MEIVLVEMDQRNVLRKKKCSVLTVRTGYRFGTCTAGCCDQQVQSLVNGGEF